MEVLYQKESGIATAAISREKAYNALNGAVICGEEIAIL
jgi:enoyl-CoA hydratase/carnithine racemase